MEQIYRSHNDQDRSYIQDIDQPPQLKNIPTRGIYAHQTPYELFEEKSSTKQQCSAGCSNAYKSFREQKKKEQKLIEQQKEKEKENRKTIQDVTFRRMNAEDKIVRLMDNAKQDMNRAYNLHRGYLTRIQNQLDSAYDIVKESEKRNTESPTETNGSTAQEQKNTSTQNRWQVNSGAKERLLQLRAQFDAQNWAYMDNLTDIVLDGIGREMALRKILKENNIPDPYVGEPLYSTITHEGVKNIISRRNQFPPRKVVSKFYTENNDQ